MKFTEGYWCMREDINHLYALSAYEVQPIPGGMRVIAPCKPMRSRGDVPNMPVLTIEFTSPAKNVVGVKAYHHLGYEKKDPRFEKHFDVQQVSVEIGEDVATMRAGRVAVEVDLKNWGYRFIGDGKVLTSSDFRNLGFMEAEKVTPSMFPGDRYLADIKKRYMVDELALDVGECIYGLGERFSAFVKNGQQLDTWNEDGGTSSPVAYKCIPFYLSSKGYGVLVDHTDNVSFEIGSEKVQRVGFSVPGEQLRYYVFYGPSPKEVIESYTAVTGRPSLPPAWSFGLWLSTSFTTSYDEQTVTQFIQGMIDRDIPLSVFHFDCFWMKEFNLCDLTWDERVFPDPAGMLARYKAKGLKIDLWINPYISQQTEMFREGMAKGYLLMRADGKGVRQMDTWQPGMALVDFTNPDAYRWFQDKLRALIAIGVDAFKTDFGERIPTDVRYFDGSDPQGMHNYYTYLYNKCVHEVLMETTGEPVLFARSATVGSQKFPVHWGGDCSATYTSMSETLRGGLSFAQSGFAFWSHDISGFEQTASPDVYKRWSAFGLLSTHSRLHGSTSYRVPWLFGEEASDVVRFFAKLKCRLMPYIYRMSALAAQKGYPVMRPMPFEFPEDPACAYLDRQYMLGDALLVAPVFSADHTVQYYLPEGRWTHLLSGEVREGGRWYRDTYDYFSLGLYVAPNTLLALGAQEDRPDYDYAKGVSLHLYQLADDGRAVCEIPDLNGSTVSTVSAVREKNRLTFTFDALPTDGKIVLEGITAAAKVEGAEIQTGEKALTLGNLTEQVIVTL